MAIIESIGEHRIRIINNQRNRGLIYSLNKGFGWACGEYIARMDCDDTSRPICLEKRVDLMQGRPQGSASNKV